MAVTPDAHIAYEGPALDLLIGSKPPGEQLGKGLVGELVF